MPPQDYSYPPSGNQASPHAPVQQPPPLMQYAQPQGHAQHPGPHQNPPYAPQQPDMYKPTYPPSSDTHPLQQDMHLLLNKGMVIQDTCLTR